MKDLTRLDKLKISFINSAIDSLSMKLDSSDGWEYDYEIEDDRKDFLYGSDIDFDIVKSGKDFKIMEDFFNKNSINFISSVLEDMDSEDLLIYKNKRNIWIGFFCGEQIKSLKIKLENLKLKIFSQDNVLSKKVSIFYKFNLGRISFDGGESFLVEFSGIEKDLFDKLASEDKEIKISWDEIRDTLETFETLVDTKTKKRIADTVNRINNKSSLYLDKNKALVGKGSNEYWLNYDVTRSD